MIRSRAQIRAAIKMPVNTRSTMPDVKTRSDKLTMVATLKAAE